jgi:hypothetical protein
MFISYLLLRYGINAFDTSPYYGNSEITLGAILGALAKEHPRSSYSLVGPYLLTSHLLKEFSSVSM